MQSFRIAFPIALVLFACTDPEEPALGEVESELTAAQKNTALRGTLEAPASTQLPGAAELDMPAGRLSRIPVSWFFAGKATFNGATSTLKVRARCGAGVPASRCNPAMVVTYRYCTANCTGTPTWSAAYSFSNLDTMFVTGQIADASVSITPNATATRHELAAYVYSENRGTSQVTIDWCGTTSCTFSGTTGWSTAWTNAKTGAATTCATCNVGGTAVYAGRMQAGDGLQVRTPGGPSSTSHATDLLTFPAGLSSSGSGTTGGAVFADRSYCGLDCGWDEPAASFPSGSANQVIAVLGKDTIGSGNSGLEIFADLLRYPLSSSETSVALATSTTLGVGRYYVKIKGYTTPNQGFAELTPGVPATYHEADDGNSACPQSESQPILYSRGRGNERALVMRVFRNNVLHASRDVPLASFGGGHRDWQTFIMEIDNDLPANTWRVEVANKASGVNLQSNWFWTRNPDAAELRIATLNTHKEWEQGMRDSTARLLAGRGSYDDANDAIVGHSQQDPYEWQADVIALQELATAGDGTSFLTALAAWTNSGWSHTIGKTEEFHLNANNGGTYVRDYYQSATGAQPYNQLFDQDALLDAGCNSPSSGGVWNTLSCPAGYCDDCAPYNTYAYLRSVPARARVYRRGASAGTRPVAVFNTHLMTDNWGTEFNTRRQGLEYLITEIGKLTTDPRTAGNFTAQTASFGPTNTGNRFIIIGDLNMQANQCGEFAWFVRRLREEFGYAVDPSSAFVDALGRTQDAHYSGARLDSGAGTYVACNGGNAWMEGATSAVECPMHWVHRNYFLEHSSQLTTSQATWQGWFPWWATTSHSNSQGAQTAGERYDAMILVGRGWADDDPVLTYKVMSNRAAASPSNNLEGGGVRMSGDVESCSPDSPGVVPPNVSGMYLSTCNGVPTDNAVSLHSDHRPVGARLRVVGR